MSTAKSKAILAQLSDKDLRLVPFDRIFEKSISPSPLDIEKKEKELKSVTEQDIKQLYIASANLIEKIVYEQPIHPSFPPKEINAAIYDLFINARDFDSELRNESEEIIRYYKFFYSIEKALREKDFERILCILEIFRPGYVISQYLKDFENRLDADHKNLTRLFLTYDMPDDFYSSASSFMIKSQIFLVALQKQLVHTIIREIMRWGTQGRRSPTRRIVLKAKNLVDPSKRINDLYASMVHGLRTIYLYTVNAELFNIDSLEEIEWGDGKLCYSKVPSENKDYIMNSLHKYLNTLENVINDFPECIQEFLQQIFALQSHKNSFEFFGLGIIDSFNEEQEKSIVNYKEKIETKKQV
ncbi:MAG: hypothetical protein ACXADY_16825 [Candidatus Hodarchaeales archaeon]|jgi:hypothetical protein